MTPDVFWDVAWKVGLPFVMVVFALVTGQSGLWVWRREVEDERRLAAERLAETVRVAKEREAELLERERYWRDRFWSNVEKTDRALEVGEKAFDLVERQAPRGRSTR